MTMAATQLVRRRGTAGNSMEKRNEDSADGPTPADAVGGARERRGSREGGEEPTSRGGGGAVRPRPRRLRPRPAPSPAPRRSRSAPPTRSLLAVAAMATLTCLLPLPGTDAFAAWFVDRRASCFTEFVPGEVVMNAKIVGPSPSSSERAGLPRLDVVSLDGEDDEAAPGSEYAVRFAIPDEAKAKLADVQYALELSDGAKHGGPPPAKWTHAPPGGGIGCEGRRGHGKAGSDSAAIFEIDANAEEGARMEVVAGWATGHEAVTLTERVVLVVGEGIIKHDNVLTPVEQDDEVLEDDLKDDEAVAELEEAELEEEEEELEEEIDEAEEDVVEALEEKRRETDGLGKAINEAEEEVVEALEENRAHVREAVKSLEGTIERKRLEKLKGQVDGKIQHLHTEEERRKAREKHVDQWRLKESDKLEEMRRRFANVKDDRRDKLEDLTNARDALRDNVQRLQNTDRREHDRAQKHHVKPLPMEELKVDMEELKRKARMKVHDLGDRLGVNELMNEPRVRKMRGRMRKGMQGGSNLHENHGAKGRPLPPHIRRILLIVFALFGGIGLGRYQLEKRKRTRKGRRTL
ncbi:hypothetical protein ACHAWF_014709 [Thalassiosira exigua]